MKVDFRTLHDRITIEPMAYEDLDQVVRIERYSFPQPWTDGGFKVELERFPSKCLVAKDRHLILGYLIIWLLPPEAHVLNIAVRNDFRRRGIGELLLNYMVELGKEIDIDRFFLEVRPSNVAAIRLYQKVGFKFTGIRKNYYAEEKEDALLMTKRV